MQQQLQQQSHGNLIQVPLKTWMIFFLFSKMENLEKCELILENFAKFSI